jgi:hypothetical protein
MNKINDIFSEHKKDKSSFAYDVPNDYFENLNKVVLGKVIKSKKTPIFKLNYFYKYAAAIALIVASYWILSKQAETAVLDCTNLSYCIDDYLTNDDEVFYTFIDEVESTEYLNIDENISDYLVFEF